MADRRVTRTGKDGEGDIIKLCNPNAMWKPRLTCDVISDIEMGKHKYYVQVKNHRSEIGVVNGPKGKYLRTNPDGHGENNLDNLPNC